MVILTCWGYNTQMDPEFDQQWLKFLLAVRPLQRNPIEVRLPREKKDLSLAAACFFDTKEVLKGAYFAYLEFLRVRQEFKGKDSEEDKAKAIFLELHHLDDILIRLYPSGEHLADAISYMLELKKEDLDPYEERRTSRQGIVGNYLHDKIPDHPITRMAQRLMDSPAWRKAMDYRHDWVHGQPPIVQGTGHVYERKSGWRLGEGGQKLPSPAILSTNISVFGWRIVEGKHLVPLMASGDPPQFITDDILAFTRPALSLFIEVALGCIDFYEKLLGKYDIITDHETGGIKGTLFRNGIPPFDVK